MVCRSGRCPSIEVLEEYQPRQTSKLYAADGRFIAELGLERRTIVQLNQIPKPVQDAFVATEDKRFWEHHGVDYLRIPGSIISDIRSGGYSQGFSTITMQLARNIFPERISREKSLVRKLKEAKVAREIEQKYGKDHILELYLNQIYLGNGAYGIESAAERYFGKSVGDLNLAEAATLAALPKSPTRYNPRKNPEQSLQRRNTILELMRADGKISDADANLARAYPLRLGSKDESGEIAPDFVEYIRGLLDEKFGKQLYGQGLKVYTTLDIDLELTADLSQARSSDALTDTLDYQQLHAQVVAIVGSTSFALLERLGAAILTDVLRDARVVNATITLAKPKLLAGATPSVTLRATNGGRCP